MTLCTSTMMMNELTTIPVTPDYNYSIERIYENEYNTTTITAPENTASWQYSQNNNNKTTAATSSTSSTTVFSYSTPTDDSSDDSSTGGAGSVTEVIEVVDDDW